MTGHWSLDLLLIGGGLAVLTLGSRLLVDNSLQVARAFQISEAVIGLTVVAFGTSVPELATSIVAAVRRQPDIALGNVIGSNIFNILSILGITALVAPITTNGIQVLDYAMMVGVSLLILPFLSSDLRLARVEGAILLGLYGGYLYLLWPK
jgi:cation:H+ antiporter